MALSVSDKNVLMNMLLRIQKKHLKKAMQEETSYDTEDEQEALRCRGCFNRYSIRQITSYLDYQLTLEQFREFWAEKDRNRKANCSGGSGNQKKKEKKNKKIKKDKKRKAAASASEADCRRTGVNGDWTMPSGLTEADGGCPGPGIPWSLIFVMAVPAKRPAARAATKSAKKPALKKPAAARGKNDDIHAVVPLVQHGMYEVELKRDSQVECYMPVSRHWSVHKMLKDSISRTCDGTDWQAQKITVEMSRRAAGQGDGLLPDADDSGGGDGSGSDGNSDNTNTSSSHWMTGRRGGPSAGTDGLPPEEEARQARK
ncbi:unnamed protein product [Symbiodinium microadriaticum]|nr:unnamed protein product [Symbiodinium microadriaticum]